MVSPTEALLIDHAVRVPGVRRDDAEIFCFPARPTAAFCNGEFAISQLLFDAWAFAGQFFRKQHAYETGRQSEGNEMKHFAAQQNPQNRPC
jgi:hypothetical protein